MFMNIELFLFMNEGLFLFLNAELFPFMNWGKFLLMYVGLLFFRNVGLFLLAIVEPFLFMNEGRGASISPIAIPTNPETITSTRTTATIFLFIAPSNSTRRTFC